MFHQRSKRFLLLSRLVRTSAPSSSPISQPHHRRWLSSVTTSDEDSTTLSSTSSTSSSSAVTRVPPQQQHQHQRIWLARKGNDKDDEDDNEDDNDDDTPLFWSADVLERKPAGELASLLQRIERQELNGARMRTKQFGVLHEDPVIDMRLLAENYTVPSLASALRDREEILQYCATLARNNEFDTLTNVLHTFHPDIVLERRQKVRRLDVRKPLTPSSLETVRKALMRMPRRVTSAHDKRAGVVIPICHVNGVPSLLLEKRATHLRAHPDEVCLPGGMVCSVADRTIVETCLREMQEEIEGVKSKDITILGVLRCNWGEVHHLVGVAVTPVVCVLNQDLAEAKLTPNPEEVAEVFTIPLASLLDKSQWIYKDDHAPIFVGGPYVIWGLTGYILERFWKDILVPSGVRE